MTSADLIYILASGSPRRREFMDLLGLPYKVIVPSHHADVDETPLPAETPTALVQRLSRLKAGVMVDLLPPLSIPPPVVIIAADTVVVSNEKILGKPKDAADATAMLQTLRRQPHQVYTGFTVALPRATVDLLRLNPDAAPAGDHYLTRLHESVVQMRPYSDVEIEAYIASGDPMDKAGAYGIQNKAFAPVAGLNGCFASVMGLPLGDLVAALRDLHLPLPPNLSQIGPLCAQFTGHPCCQQ